MWTCMNRLARKSDAQTSQVAGHAANTMLCDTRARAHEPECLALRQDVRALALGKRPRNRWQRWSWGIVLAAAFSTNSASADVIWIGRPTARDYMAYNAQKAIEGYVALREHMAQFESQVRDARQAYFAAPASERASAGDKFGEMLFQKDLLIAAPQIIGSDDQAKLMGSLIALANNARPPDGGIPPSARKAFNVWVSTVRLSAGGSLARAAAAMNSSSNLKEYEAYRRLRDQAEWDEFESRRTGAARKLLEPGVTISPSSYFGETPFMQGFDLRVAKLPNKILQCIYAGRQVQGSVFHYWQGKAPDEIAFLMAMNMSAFVGLQDHAVEQCPANSNEASAIASSPAKVVITREMAKEARDQQNKRPLDPAEAHAMRERNEAARQRGAERKAAQDEKAAMFRACYDAHKSEVFAAQAARDNTAIAAAHRRNLECNGLARARSR